MEAIYKINIVVVFMSMLLHGTQISARPNSDENIAAMKKALIDTCMAKYPLTPDIIDSAKKGLMPDDRNFKCFLMCNFDEMSLIDSETADIDVDTMVSLIPDEDMKAVIKKAADHCLPNIAGKPDTCEVSYNFAVCALKVDEKIMKIFSCGN
ncbi:general odorant-binding protein 69a [Daktulosphaira vitifoliae]|uniref:general odorant-binding protein 69a n=1 Tax=Daktulosphaira vitifoliae TaxID=58002 RepID=UPI0021AA4C96|nr:general odorant-binding protein 69a [Daktulosphaira vitifoliae]